MTANQGENARTYEGSLIGQRIKADQANSGNYFAKTIGHRGFDVNDSFIVTADNQGDPHTRIITFEDLHGRVATGVAGNFIVIE